jgi:CRP/FNR family cyclic AMP-dependent transcriptional regulator
MRPLSRRSRAEVLRSVPLFSRCSRSELDAIAALTTELAFEPGRTLTREGTPGLEFFVLLEGAAAVRRKGRRVGTLGAGDFVGEVALVSGLPRTATVTITAPSRVLVVSASEFRELLLAAPSTALKIVEALGRRLAELVREP